MTIANFLLARIAEDEYDANRELLLGTTPTLTRMNARVLDECAAKRAIFATSAEQARLSMTRYAAAYLHLTKRRSEVAADLTGNPQQRYSDFNPDGALSKAIDRIIELESASG